MLRATLLLLVVLRADAFFEETKYFADQFVKYYSYTGTLTVGGQIGPITQTGTAQHFTYSLTGLDTACSSGATIGTANSCGIHIHVGRDCTTDAGGHFYTVASDPWDWTTSYTSSTTGTASGSLTVKTGVTPLSEINGKVMIVHDSSGARIGCAPIEEPNYLQRLAAIPRVSKDNCKNIMEISKGNAKAKLPFDVYMTPSSKDDKAKASALRALPILNEANCAKAFPVYFTRG